MSRWRPCKRRVFIKRLKKLGFIGPYSGTRHQFMVYHEHRLAIPSNVEYSISQLRLMLSEMEQIMRRRLTAGEWEELK